MRSLTRLLLPAALAVALTSAVAAAQAPPSPPHTFFGENPLLDGASAPDGTPVTAINEEGVAVATAEVEAGTWVLQVDPANGAQVSIQLNGAGAVGPYDVESGALTEVLLDVTSGASPANGGGAGTPGGLPSGGSGGLGDGDGAGNLIPLFLAAGVALLAVAGAREWARR